MSPTLLVMALAACERSAAPPAAGDSPAATRAAARATSAAAQRLREITDRYYDQWLELHPLEATDRGDHRFDARFGDYASQQWVADRLGIEQESLERLNALEPEQLGADDRLTYDAFKLGREIAIKGYRYPSELLPVQQFGGLHARFATLGSFPNVFSLLRRPLQETLAGSRAHFSFRHLVPKEAAGTLYDAEIRNDIILHRLRENPSRQDLDVQKCHWPEI